MHDAYIPLFFARYNRPLRGVMIDQQPWFSAVDLARLLAFRSPNNFHQRFYAHEVRSVRLAYAGGSEEQVLMLSEAALYKALVRFGHPEVAALDRWLALEVVPTLRDTQGREGEAPRRVLMTWQARRLMLLNWQGALWLPWEAMPRLAGA